MELWQLIVIAFLLLLPLALVVDFWPQRERLDSQGQPLPRSWSPAPTPVVHDDEHH